jgi:hypothetical protein
MKFCSSFDQIEKQIQWRGLLSTSVERTTLNVSGEDYSQRQWRGLLSTSVERTTLNVSGEDYSQRQWRGI